MADVAAKVQPSAAGMDDGDNVVRLEDLYVNFYTTLGVVRALNGVSFNIPRGKVLGVVGESGCGKSITGLSILQLVPRPGKTVSGKILFQEDRTHTPVDLLQSERDSSEIREIRGNQISMIFQEPMTSLNPCYTVGAQIEEAVLRGAAARDRHSAEGGHAQPNADRRQLSASAERRYAPARHDRHGAFVYADAADRR